MKKACPISVALTTMLILITIQSTTAHAQFGGYAGSSLQLGFDAQSVALGNAVSAGFGKQNPMDSTNLEVQPY